MDLVPGARLDFRWRKWDGSPHWEHDLLYLGADAWGDWFGQPAGWRSHRPGRDMTAETANVILLPADSTHWVATMNAPPHPTSVYIDIAWDAHARGPLPTAIDMDLDVLRCVDERGTFIDDEDEWAEHRERFGYPAEVVDLLEHVTAELERTVRAERAPFDAATRDRWLAVLEAVASGNAPGARLDSIA